MSRAILSGLLVVSSVVGIACTDDSSSSSSVATGIVVTDTLGKVFSVSVSGGFCSLTPADSTLKPLSCEEEYGAGEVFALVWGSQILRVHAVQIPMAGYVSFNPSEPGHPIACTTDADCAPSLFSPPFTCQYGLCQYVSDVAPMQTIDVIALCQADLPWPTSCPYLTDPMFASRMAEVAALCGPNAACSKVPADCRQPGPPSAPPPPAPTAIDGGADPVGGAVDGGVADGGI
jgi:hypothetical protein